MKKLNALLVITFLTLSVLTLRAALTHADDMTDHGMMNKKAIGGYDPVAYFTKGMPVMGDENINYESMGKIWLFSSDEHKRMFMDNPEKYMPQYDGQCAFAVSKGSRAPGDPAVWSIVNGKLYFNMNKSVQAAWENNKMNNIETADQIMKK